MLTAADVATGGAHAFDYSPDRPARGYRQRLAATDPQPGGDTGSQAPEPGPRLPSSSAGPLSGG
jgi:hypothetical protein